MILKRLKVDTTLGEPTNCYIVEDEETKETMVIDPGGEADKIIEMLDITPKTVIAVPAFRNKTVDVRIPF